MAKPNRISRLDLIACSQNDLLRQSPLGWVHGDPWADALRTFKMDSFLEQIGVRRKLDTYSERQVETLGKS